jgi:hypothetical protein
MSENNNFFNTVTDEDETILHYIPSGDVEQIAESPTIELLTIEDMKQLTALINSNYAEAVVKKQNVKGVDLHRLLLRSILKYLSKRT